MILKKLRQNINKTQKEVADDLQIQRTKYARYETGESDPDLDMLKKLADYFHVTVDYLIGHEVPYLLDKSILTDKQNKLINLIQNLKDSLCEKVEGYILGVLEMENDKEVLTRKTRR